MRRILVEAAPAKKRRKCGGETDRDNDFDLANVAGTTRIATAGQLLELDEALERLKTEDPLVAEVVTLRLYAGLSVRETATAMGISRSTVDGYWQYALSWFAVGLS